MIDRRSRVEIRRLCAHVVSRERHGRTGRIGLWWTGRGIGTDAMWLGVDGLHRQQDGALPGHALTTLGDLAAWAGVDLTTDFSVGTDTPDVGDPTAPLEIVGDSLGELLALYEWAWQVLVPTAEGATVTLWPEHFDAAYIWHDRANIGVSPGDDHSPTPYLYVGPWDPEAHRDNPFWNSPFGATTPAPANNAEAIAFINQAKDHLKSAT